MWYRVVMNRLFRSLAGLWLLLAGGLSPLSGNPDVALVAAGEYGKAEVRALIGQVLGREVPDLTFEEHEGLLPAADFSKYKLVVIAGAPSGQSYTAEEAMQIEEAVEKGGRLLLIQHAPGAFASPTGVNQGRAFPYGRSHYLQVPQLTTVLEPGAKLLEGVFSEEPAPFWLNGNVLLQTDEWESLIGSETHLLVGFKTIGKGRVYYVGPECFRILGAAGEGAKRASAEGWLRLLRNIFTDNPEG